MEKSHNLFMIKNLYFRPIISLLFSYMAGILLGLFFDNHLYVFVAIAIVCLLYILFLIIQKKNSIFLPIILFLSLGYICINPYVTNKYSPNHITNYINNNKWEITGYIDQDPDKYKNKVSFVLSNISLRYQSKVFKVIGKLRVSVFIKDYNKSFNYFKNDKISFTSRLKPIKNFNNPGRFNYVRYMAFNKIYAQTYTNNVKINFIGSRKANWFENCLINARKTVSNLIDKSDKSKFNGVLKALLIGKKKEITPKLKNIFNRAGIGHVLAISGLHIGIVATFSFLFFSWLLSFSKTILWYGLKKKGAALLTIIPVLAYGLLSGMSFSTQRALIMVFVFLFAFIIEKEHDTFNTLAIAAMIILVFYPPSLFSISFQLSFVAVFSIVYGLSKIQNINIKEKNEISKKSFILRKLYPFCMVTIFATLGTLPIIMYYFNQVSTISFVSNLVFVPVIGFIVVPLGLLALLIYPISYYASFYCIKICAFILNQTLAYVSYLSEFSYAAVKTITPNILEIFLYYALIYILLNFKDVVHYFKKYKRIKVLVFMLIFLGFADIYYCLYNRFFHTDLKVTIIDVGKASAALLELPKGYIILIDGGGFYGSSTFDVGEKIVARVLLDKKIKTVNTLILSHPDSDHLNGLVYISKYFNVSNLWTNSQSTDTIAYKKLLENVSSKKINMPNFSKLKQKYFINKVEIEILYPPKDFIMRKQKDKWRDFNNNSLVAKVTYKKVSFLFPGDIMKKAEAEIVKIYGKKLQSNVLIAPHHGSRTSSTKYFIDYVNPKVVLISAGGQKAGKAIPQSSLKRYKNKGCIIYRTDKNGAITISTNGASINVETFND